MMVSFAHIGVGGMLRAGPACWAAGGPCVQPEALAWASMRRKDWDKERNEGVLVQEGREGGSWPASLYL